LFAETVQADIDDRMAKACEELVEIHRLRDIAKKKAAEEAKTNKTGNKNAKVYVNSAKRGTAIGKADAKKGVAEDSDDSDADEDDYLNDPELERIRLARIAKLKKLQAQRKMGFGEYREIIESEFLKEVTSLKFVICHFFHDEFQRCKIIDEKLRMIAQAHREVKFIRLNVQKAQFMVQKLSIKTLPTIVLFTDGVAKDRIVGFDELGGRDVFPTRFLELRIKMAGLILDESEFGTYPDDVVEEPDDSDEDLIY